jgi:hypothetical protein
MRISGEHRLVRRERFRLEERAKVGRFLTDTVELTNTFTSKAS